MRLCNVFEMPRRTSMNPLRKSFIRTILLYYSTTKMRQRFDTLAYLFLPVEFADLNVDISKVFFQHREKEVTRVSLPEKRNELVS